ncbi:MAG: pyridoxamine 5'-phosphate oxidase [Cytophagales bacterium]|nr:MAG: pyridoxamine 5'-phosphate oxidase [Cytophagales bacterium]
MNTSHKSSLPSLAEIRQEYSLKELSEQSVSSDAIVQFESWLTEALNSELTEPTAMHLSTVSSSGYPSSRIVLLKGIEEGSFLFYTNYQSRKGDEIMANSRVALCFFWAELQRQVRIEGTAESLIESYSEVYFNSRPRASQIGALASPQSKIIPNRAWLEKEFEAIEEKYKHQAVPKPEHWGGYKVVPHYIEFWQGRRSRLHDRIVYTRIENKWHIERLAP